MTPSALLVLQLRAEARALLWQAGEIPNYSAALEPLVDYAESAGLIERHGAEAVHALIGDAFKPCIEAP